MGKKCLKCNYERAQTDYAPDYECPRCGVIYSKFEAALKKQNELEQNKPALANKAQKQSTEIIIMVVLKKLVIYIKESLIFQKFVTMMPTFFRSTSNNPRLIKCKICSKDVSKSAKICPHCGEKDPAPAQKIDFFTAFVMILIFLWIFGKFSGPDGSSETSKQISVSSEFVTTGEAEKSLSVPSDPKAQFFILDKGGSDSERTIVTKRVGPSGISYSKRLYNCSNSTVKYLGTGDSLTEMALSKTDQNMVSIVPGSIAYYVGVEACK